MSEQKVDETIKSALEFIEANEARFTDECFDKLIEKAANFSKTANQEYALDVISRIVARRKSFDGE